MRYLIYILIGLFVLCSTANKSYGQFWKKKGQSSHRKADSFAGKSKKGPNVYSAKPPRTKSRGKLYKHSVSKKKGRNKPGTIFSSSKRRFKSTVNTKAKEKKDRGAPGASGGRKSGKGRKKEK